MIGVISDMNYSLLTFVAVIILMAFLISASFIRTYLKKESKTKNVIIINRAWIFIVIEVLGAVLLGSIFTFVNEWIGYVLIVIEVIILIVNALFECFSYEFTEEGVVFKGAFYDLGYIEYNNIKWIDERSSVWFKDSILFLWFVEYYNVSGTRCVKKFDRSDSGLMMIKTKKTTALLKQHCPLKFPEPKERAKPVHRKRKPHQKKK